MFSKLLNVLKENLQTRDDRRVEDRLYELIYHEIETNNLHPAAKARALADGGDSDKLIKQSYIRHRLRMLKDGAASSQGPSNAGPVKKPAERPMRVTPQKFADLSEKEQLQDFITRMGHVDDITVAQMLVAAIAELDRMTANSPDTKSWFMEYSPSHDHDLLNLSNALDVMIKVYQSSGEMMRAPPLMIWMHTARGILDKDLTADVVEMWKELSRRGSANLHLVGWTMLEGITGEMLDRAKTFQPEALFQRYQLIDSSPEEQIESELSSPKNDFVQSNDASKVTDIILDTLQMQLDLSGAASKKIPDDYVVGYIAGYCDAIMQKKGIDNSSVDGLSVLTITFLSLYGFEIGNQRLGDFFKQQSSMSEYMYAGLQRGGKDVFEWLSLDKQKAGSKGPMGLFQYLTKNNN